MKNDRFWKACEKDMARHPGLVRRGHEGLLWFEAAADNVHNVDFDSTSGRWTTGAFVNDKKGCFTCGHDRSVTLVGEDEWFLNFRLEQPAELVEFITFYRQAKQVIRRPRGHAPLSLADVIDRPALPFRIKGQWRLLPVDSGRALKGMPADLIENVTQNLRRQDVNGITLWGYIGDKWAKVLKPVTRPMDATPAFWGPPWHLQPVGHGEGGYNSDVDDMIPLVWMRPRENRVAWMYSAEYFMHTQEGQEAVKQVFAGGPLHEIAKRLRSTQITIPQDRLQQIRQAIEWRSARLACHEAARALIDKLSPAAKLTGRYRKLMEKFQ